MIEAAAGSRLRSRRSRPRFASRRREPHGPSRYDRLVRRARPLALGPVTLAGLAAQTAPAGAAGPRPKTVVTPNWSGYVATSPAGSDRYFTRVTGTPTAPRAHCRPGKRGSSSTVWIGLGGFHSGNRRRSVPTRTAARPGSPRTTPGLTRALPLRPGVPEIKDEVRPGDRITGLVRVIDPRLVELRLHNRTPRLDVHAQDHLHLAGHLDRRMGGRGTGRLRAVPLPRGRPRTLRRRDARRHLGDRAQGRGNACRPALRGLPPAACPVQAEGADAAPEPDDRQVEGADQGGIAASPAGATPGVLATDGRSFTVKWVPVATRNV